ncbi:MAG: UDP-N-acetylglucosamine--N-acetylmuramyl-(pentapeptide) pyrophosphoryl-undecaprenol N-acetylglucosamine transferase [Desulfovibrio fairfieldensis]
MNFSRTADSWTKSSDHRGHRRHIFPALAVAEEIRRRNPRGPAVRGFALWARARLAAQAGIPFAGLPVRGFLGRGLRAVGAGARMTLAVWKALGIVRRFRPQAVAGFGGYAAFAPMLAARLQGVPGILHEQNAVAGTSNRTLARLARVICCPCPAPGALRRRKACSPAIRYAGP